MLSPAIKQAYPVFVFSGLLVWQLFARSMSEGGMSLVNQQNLLTKVYFPRLVIPVGRILALLLDVAVAVVVVLVAVALYGLPYRVEMLLAPAFLLLAFTTAAGAGIFLAAINVKYRDVTVIMPLAVQLWLFATPVLYPGSLVTGAWQYVYALNPMVSAVQGMRWAMLGTPAPSLGALAISVGAAAALLVAGLLYFRRTEHYFADVI
jgi:lipopolysaccharide transport system permease protein